MATRNRSGSTATLLSLCAVVGEIPGGGLFVDDDDAFRFERTECTAHGPRAHRFAVFAQSRIDAPRRNAVGARGDEFLEHAQHEIDLTTIGGHAFDPVKKTNGVVPERS